MAARYSMGLRRAADVVQTPAARKYNRWPRPVLMVWVATLGGGRLAVSQTGHQSLGFIGNDREECLRILTNA
jgi:hypothetical protein